MGESNTGKVYFLSDRGRRSAARLIRKRSDPQAASPVERHPPTPQETAWLARLLFIEGLYLVLMWVAEGTDILAFERNGEIRNWMLSLFPAEILVAAAAIFGAYQLQRVTEKRDVFALVAAGGLMFLAVERLALLASAAVGHVLSPGERLQVTAMLVCIGVSVWTISHSMRLRIERRPAA